VHRASLQKALVSGAQNSSVVKFQLGKQVVSYDFDNTKFLVEDRKTKQQEWVQADVLLCSDGVKSKARGEMMKRRGEEDHVEDTGQAAYRILVKREMINEDPDLVPFFEGSHSYRWIGEKRHIIVSANAKCTDF
jgi:salicylate hydroxylase